MQSLFECGYVCVLSKGPNRHVAQKIPHVHHAEHQCEKHEHVIVPPLGVRVESPGCEVEQSVAEQHSSHRNQGCQVSFACREHRIVLNVLIDVAEESDVPWGQVTVVQCQRVGLVAESPSAE